MGKVTASLNLDSAGASANNSIVWRPQKHLTGTCCYTMADGQKGEAKSCSKHDLLFKIKYEVQSTNTTAIVMIGPTFVILHWSLLSSNSRQLKSSKDSSGSNAFLNIMRQTEPEKRCNQTSFTCNHKAAWLRRSKCQEVPPWWNQRWYIYIHEALLCHLVKKDSMLILISFITSVTLKVALAILVFLASIASIRR